MTSQSTPNGGTRPMFSAVTTSARRLFQLLKCINFTSKVYVQITEKGLRFSAQESHIMQGHVMLESKLFSSYIYEPPAQDDEESDSELEDPVFMINLDAILETLQIFGAHESKDGSWREPDAFAGAIPRNRRGVFDSNILGTNNICKLSYASEGAPFCIVIEESGVTTTCELNTYEAEDMFEIPFQKERVVNKVITRSEWLFDAIKELNAASPTKLTVTMSPSAPYFALSAIGPHSSATIEFKKDKQLLETFQATKRISNAYKYSLVKGAGRAMAIASKVSVRNDIQGVLSLQFMIEIEEGKITFVDFRFVPYIDEENEANDVGLEEYDGSGDDNSEDVGNGDENDDDEE